MYHQNKLQKVKTNSVYRLLCNDSLTSSEAGIIRSEIETNIKKDWQTIYIDTSDVVHIDLFGINEIIHTAYYLSNSSKELIVAYRKKSPVGKWIETTNIHRFIKTAILPDLS